ncbi:MAG: bifunctional riboflavin kinase/FAD synthetase [Deltaproteobacteria bacterium]|nr:bifunctional riboflavin kinase/FAD synthetase [Deltaproteobacteria bacterium]
MKIIRSLEDDFLPLQESVVTIGNFDGIHLGHREIFRKVVSTACQCHLPSVVFTFVPHPMEVLAPARAPQLINTYQEKEILIQASCVEVLICAPFTAQMARFPASFFLEKILLAKLGMKKLIVGYDYTFGKNREGDTTYLLEQSAKLGFDVEVLKPISHGDQIFSSTVIRKLIAEGKVGQVIPLLGRNFSIKGKVKKGFKRGKKLGFPTANLILDKKILPCPGVYAAKVRLARNIYDGVINIGYNPTFFQSELSFEVHILDFDLDIYGKNLRVYFVERLRDEKLFPTEQALVEAIHRDVQKAKTILRDQKVIEYRDYLDCGPCGSKGRNRDKND